MGGLWRAAVALAVAGCLQPATLATTPTVPGPPAAETFTDAHDGCTGYLLALLVDPALTDPYLPPGFHLRDPQDFLQKGTGTGQALLLVWAALCEPTAQQPAWRDGSAAIYVQPPAVEGDRPTADHDLYEIAHYSPEPSMQQRLAAWRWPVANVSLDGQAPAPQAAGQAFSFAAGSPQGAQTPILPGVASDALFSFGGPTPLPPQAFGPRDGVLRTWRDTPAGLGHLDQSMALALNLGGGYCAFQQDSVLAQATGQTACGAPSQGLVATFRSGIHTLGVMQREVRAR